MMMITLITITVDLDSTCIEYVKYELQIACGRNFCVIEILTVVQSFTIRHHYMY